MIQLSAGEAIRRRRRTAARCQPLECGRRDPQLDPTEPYRRQPSTFGLTLAELKTEITRCQRAGWSPEDIRCTFVNPLDLQRQLNAAREADHILHPHLEHTYV